MDLSETELTRLMNLRNKASGREEKGKGIVIREGPSKENTSRHQNTQKDKGKEKEIDKTHSRQERGAYDDLENVTVSMTTLPKVWKDEDLNKIKIVGLTRLGHEEVIMLGKEVFDKIASETFSAKDVYSLLNLAVSMFEIGSGTNEISYLLKPLPTGMGSVISEHTVDLGSDVNAKKDKLESQIRSTKQSVARATGGRKADYEKLLANLESKLSETVISGDMPQATEESMAYAYMAAYTLRLYGKTQDAWITKLETAKTRFLTWYNYDSEFLGNLELSEDQARRIREALARKPECVSTWVMWVAFNENEGMSVQAGGMMRYLAAQMFAYTSMHAYAFVTQIQVETGVSFRVLLEELDCPATRKSVREIANVIRNYEVTEKHPDRRTYFRYSRVWDSGYFQNLQTNNCKMLAYVAARTKQMISGQVKGSNPTEVYALKSLDQAMKTNLDQVATRLFNLIMRLRTVDSKSGSIWEHMTLGATA